MTGGFWLNPRLGRVISSIYTVEAISDHLNLTYSALKKLEK
jgi:hypothetical protein